MNVTVFLSGKSKHLKKAPLNHWKTLKAMRVPMVEENINLEQQFIDQADLIIDAVVGYSLNRQIKGKTKNLINSINFSGKNIISLDVPTGLNASYDEAQKTCIKANATLILALPKTGLLSPKAKQFTGDIYFADIGVP